MEFPAYLKGESRNRFLQGLVAGAAATMIIGFNWGGWVLGGTANQMAETKAKSAVVAVLAPICVDKFKRATNATEQLVELKKVSTWQQGSFIEKGGWATMPGTTSPDSTVAQACAELLNAAKM